ncbi:MAG: hydrolase [Rhodospirillales bacterium]|nr:hydrolase [Rhodospirillales bacterium]
MERRELVSNVVAEAAKLYGLPIVLSSVNVETGLNKLTIHQLTDILPGITPIDRTSVNAWENVEFVAAVKATGRKKLIMVALWTEVCLIFPTLDVLARRIRGLPGGRCGRQP